MVSILVPQFVVTQKGLLGSLDPATPAFPAFSEKVVPSSSWAMDD
jgi:hypothetical protein